MSVLEQHSEATSCEVCWSAGRPDSATSWVENQPHHQHSRRPTSSSSSSLHSQQQQQQQRLPITVSQAYLHVDTRRTGAKSGQHDWCSAASRLICVLYDYWDALNSEWYETNSINAGASHIWLNMQNCEHLTPKTGENIISFILM